MAPAPPQRSEKDKRLRSILSFATEVQEQLPLILTRPPGPLSDSIQRHISTFPSNLGPSTPARCEEVDAKGTALWNLCTRLRRSYEPQDVPVILLLARVFAFLVLDAGLESGKESMVGLVRLIKIGIKVGKNCIDGKQFELALRVLEKLGKYELLLLKADGKPASRDGEGHEGLIAEYYVLRTALAWKQDQLNVAEFMFSKSMSSKQFFDAGTAESLADVLYEMGKDLLDKKQYAMAVKWLDRAYNVLVEQELDRLSMDASELRLSIMECLVKSLLALQDQDSTDKARSLVDLLENEVGDKLIVLLLRLELISAAPNESFDSNSYSDILHRTTRTVALTQSNFKLIMYHIRKLTDKNPSLACRALDGLLKLRILQAERTDWIEKVIITRIWIITNQKDVPETLVLLEEVLSTVSGNLAQPFSPAATLAAQTLLWKRIESNYTQGLYDTAEKWCRLAMHQIFEKSGEINMARISRKLLLCALARQDHGSARDTFGAMSDTTKNEPITRFLMYKVAIRSEDAEFAADCLRVIASSSKDPTLLYACVLDAQQVGNRPLALAALQLVVEKQGTFEGHSSASSALHLPSLLRITISLTAQDLDGSKHPEGSPEAEASVEKLCRFFEGAVHDMKKTRPTEQSSEIIWTVLELDWFSKNSYNQAIKHLSIWNPRHSLRMLITCIAFIDQYPKDIDEPTFEDLWLRKMFCEFSSAIALVALARAEDVIETQLQDYLGLRKHVDSFDGLLQERLEKLDEAPKQDLTQKLAVLLGFDFEAACQLKAWDDLGSVVAKATLCNVPRVYELMADCILSSPAPTQVLITTLKKIINAAWSLDSLDTPKLAKYMRCLFQIAQPDSPAIALQLLDQVHSTARDAAETPTPYPTDELEWIAARAYNHAVDLYCTNDDDASREWAARALNVAGFCADGGALEGVLRGKYAGLRWDR